VVVSMFPGLERFHCCKNLISEISSQPPLQSLRLITLEENHLSSWDSVFRLASLPRLEILILNDNQIPHIFSSETDGRSPGFLELKSLSICRNRIHDWSSIIALNSMPALRELKIKGNPLFEGESGLNSRELVIAQLPRLQGLNGSPVSVVAMITSHTHYIRVEHRLFPPCLSECKKLQ
jgi:Leucine-rich repeat (LRR) protein